MERQEKVKAGAFVQVGSAPSITIFGGAKFFTNGKQLGGCHSPFAVEDFGELQGPLPLFSALAHVNISHETARTRGSVASPCYEIRTPHLPPPRWSSVPSCSLLAQRMLLEHQGYTILISSPSSFKLQVLCILDMLAHPNFYQLWAWIPASGIALLFSPRWSFFVNMTTWVLVPQSYRLIPTVSVSNPVPVRKKMTLFIFTKSLIDSTK